MSRFSIHSQPWWSSLCLILMGWGTPGLAAEPIPIPVPPPEVNTVIPIPVPAPEVSTAPIPSPMPQPLDNSLERLPVPSAPIPLGFVGNDRAMNQLPPPPDVADADLTPLTPVAPRTRFRVIVLNLRDDDVANQERLRSLVPEVISITLGQRRALQVGSFQNEANANQMRAFMEVNGFRAEIQRLP
ncbi:SPOR domain-containing protein [Thermosynechococcus sp.]|uniref:SPOR domain-containing protein n=1 Tax=Thermosynechococcus sp. TaxID=2814275 RepID=UPI003919BE80